MSEKRLRGIESITMSTPGIKPVTISGNKFHQVAHSFKQPKEPCHFCEGNKWGKTKYGYWICVKCDRLSGWRKGDDP